MYSHFEIGEVAYHIQWECDVTITSELKLNRKVFVNGTDTVIFADFYLADRHDNEPAMISTSSGKLCTEGWAALPKYLRKKPKLNLGSWDTLESSLNWNPLKVEA